MPTTPPSQPLWIVQPNGFAVQNASVVLSWTASIVGTAGDTINYTLNYSIDNGNSWSTIISGLTTTTYNWTIPFSIAIGTSVIIQVIANESNATTNTSPNSFIFSIVSLNPPVSSNQLIEIPSTINQYEDEPRILWRKGTGDDPYVQITESLTIMLGRIVTSEVPDPFNKVAITNFFEVQDSNHTLANNEFYTDYNTGIINFNISQNNVAVNLTYKGRGKILYPANRIYIHSTNYSNNFPQVLQDIVDQYANALQVMANIVTYSKAMNDGQGFMTVSNVSLLPTASSSYRNKMAIVQGNGTTTADILYICLLSATGTYSWKQVISG